MRHPFHLLRVQGQLGDYERQQELLQKRHARDENYLFVSRFAAIQGDDEVIRTYTTWPANIRATLPCAEYVMFMASNEDGTPSHLAAAAEWSKVRQVAGHLMTPEDGYPERYHVSEFPDDSMLEQLGMADWAGG